MQVVNYKDEKNRLYKVKFFDNGINGQIDSHGYSYMKLRNEYKKLGDKMGFEAME